MSLQALISITHYAGPHSLAEIALISGTITRLVREHPDDAKIADFGIGTLDHSLVAVITSLEKPSDPKLVRALDIPEIIKVTTECLKRPNATLDLVGHAVDLLARTTFNYPNDCKAQPSMLNFLVAGLRSKDWVFRCNCLGGLVRLHTREAESDQRMLDPMRFMAAIQRRFPDHLADIMTAYGPTRCETYITLKTAADYQNAMMRCAQDKNLYALGLKLADFIISTEFSVGEGMFQGEDGRSVNVGLPFKMWSDALPHCARAIRAKGKPAEADLADILDIKYFIMKYRIPDAIVLAKKAIERSPENAYFYYAITLSANGANGLRAAKKGMKCKKITPFIRFQMMQRAVEHAGDMGVRHLQESPTVGDKKWEEGIAFLMSALEDSRTYVENAPPDNRHMKNVSYWYILLSLTVRASEISANMRELRVSLSFIILTMILTLYQSALEVLKIADDFSSHIGVPPPKTNLRLTEQTVVKLYPSAVEEWGDIIARFDAMSSAAEKATPISSEKVEDDLAAWLDGTNLDGEPRQSEPSCTRSKFSFNNVALYQCSWCGNPSAVLKKCSGCAKTR